MKRLIYIIATVALLASCATGRHNTSYTQANMTNGRSDSELYIQEFWSAAVEQMEKHKIPASITLAQALLEGGAGKSDLVREANNHFGVKADKRWKGKTYSKWDNGKWCQFRVYGSAKESFEDHSKFLLSNSRYDFLFDLRRDDYEGWAKGLKKAGYAEDNQYPTKLIGIIERYELYKYDLYKEKDINKKRKEQNNGTTYAKDGNAPVYATAPERHELLKANGLIYTIAANGDTFDSLAAELGISKRKLRKYNDLYKEYIIGDGDIIYLERKNNRAKRGNNFHTTEKGESLYDISQKYGIRLKRLYKMNPMYKEYTRLNVGDVIRLR